MLNNLTPDFFPADANIKDLKVQCRTWFSKCSVTASNREANGVAHEFDQLGAHCISGTMNMWDPDIPANISVLVTGNLPNAIS